MSDALFNTLKAANRLPSPPAVAMRILQLVADEETTLEQLTETIQTDPALTAKILKYLHSPVVGLGFEGTSLLEAVGRIGTRGTQLLALSFSLASQKQLASCPSFHADVFWSESLARAVAARLLARASGGTLPDEAFIVGLLYRIGQLVIATAAPGDYETVLRDEATSTTALGGRERAVFGCDHLELGRQLLEHWRLPESVWSALQPAASAAPAHLVHAADAIATFLNRGEQHHGRNLDALLELITADTGLDRAQARELVETAAAEWRTHGELFAVRTGRAPDLDQLEADAEEHRSALRLAAEIEVQSLRAENQQLSYLARRDRLTGLLNRGAFEQAVTAASDEAGRIRPGLALLMIDIDRFKAINDTHGHLAGDAVLRHVARVILTRVKAPAEAFRYGGEEFTVLMAGSLEAALARAEDLRAAMAGATIEHGGRNMQLTVSVGAAAVSAEQPGTRDDLVRAADVQLYSAKRAGRNCVRG